MRRAINIFAVAALLFVSLGLSAQQSNTWTGWISDSGCGAKGTNADHKACATKCVKEKGAAWVFVNSGKNNEVLNIENQDIVNPDKDLSQQVKVTGHTMDEGTIHIDSIAPAK